MDMELQGISDTKNQKQRRWSGVTLLMYIKNQIYHLTKGLLTAMSTHMTLTNNAVIEDY